MPAPLLIAAEGKAPPLDHAAAVIVLIDTLYSSVKFLIEDGPSPPATIQVEDVPEVAGATSYLAVANAINYLKNRKVEKVVLSRPAVEAGEKIGFLPGDIKEKVDPYLRPIYDALRDMMPSDKVEKKILSGEIEIAPLAFMRGRTLKNSYIIIDEAQNTTQIQMKMLLTRLGEGSRMVVTGDLT